MINIKNKIIKDLNKLKLDNDKLAEILDVVYPNQTLKPKVITNHVGIEIECFSNLDWDEVKALIYAHDLESYVNLSTDGSIENPDSTEAYELRLLIPETKLTDVLSRFKKFTKKAKLRTNSSCGLHVHLDMRKRNAKNCYDRLMKFQDVLFGLVAKNRWGNEYCEWTCFTNSLGRYVAINKLSLAKHNTIEIRLHEGTTDADKIEKWVRLLLNVISSKNTIPEVQNKNDVLSWKGLSKDLKKYVSKNFKDDWFKRKNKIIQKTTVQGTNVETMTQVFQRMS